MIGYGIPRTWARSLLSGSDIIYYEWDKGYLWKSDVLEWGLVDGEFTFLRWNDFYLNLPARKLQRWLRSFKELPPCCPCPE